MGKLQEIKNFLHKVTQKDKKWILLQSRCKGPKWQQQVLDKKKLFFSDKGLETNSTILNGKNELITDSSTLSNLFNNYVLSTLQVLWN